MQNPWDTLAVHMNGLPFTDEEIRRLAADSPVGAEWPYSGGSAEEVETFLHLAVHTLERDRSRIVKADFNHFGSGYASFVEVFCYPADNSTRQQQATGEEFEGIVYYLSRLAPVATYAVDTRLSSRQKYTGSLLSDDTAGILRDPKWVDFHRNICALLRGHSFHIADNVELNVPLPFPVKIDTNLGNSPYCLFDLLFHWMD